MNELIGMRWGDLKEETRSQLLAKSQIWDDVEEGECIFDLSETAAVAGYIKCINDDEGDYEYIILDESIIYCPQEGIVEKSKYDYEFKINEVMTVNEASEIWDKSEGTIRAAIKSNKFITGVDYRKSGRITLITKEAMERVYGEPKTEK